MVKAKRMEASPSSSVARRRGSRRAGQGSKKAGGSKKKAEGADRRMAERVAVDIDVDYSSDETFLFSNSANITNLSALGVFVETTDPAPVGTTLNLRFQVPGAEEALVLEGEVVWVNEVHRDGQANINPGMGVRFLNLELDQRQTLVGLVRTLALLMDDE